MKRTTNYRRALAAAVAILALFGATIATTVPAEATNYRANVYVNGV